MRNNEYLMSINNENERFLIQCFDFVRIFREFALVENFIR